MLLGVLGPNMVILGHVWLVPCRQHETVEAIQNRKTAIIIKINML